MVEEIREGRTKRQLEEALRQKLEEKPLEQIRVRELTELCGIRRQSFYYHFPDVPALFAWSLDRERERLLADRERCLTWRQALSLALERVAENRPYYQALLSNRGRAGLAEVLALEDLLTRVLDYYRRRSGGPPISDQERACWESLLATLLEGWIREGLTGPPEDLLALLESQAGQIAAGAAWRNQM